MRLSQNVLLAGNTSWSLDSPSGSPSEKAQDVFETSFESMGEEHRFPISIIVACNQAATCGDEGSGDITQDTHVKELINILQTQ